jgi:hypothetical protein
MSRYASNQDVTFFFSSHGIEVTNVRREGPVRQLKIQGQPFTLPMDASPNECLRLAHEFIAQLQTTLDPERHVE